MIPSASRAVRCGLLALVFPGLLAAQTATPGTTGEKKSGNDSMKLEPFQVTGSHLMRVDYETPHPVVTYTAAAIEDSGYTGLGDFIQSLSFNNAQVNTETTVGSFLTGASTANPRGLGSNRFLTLINGRRTVPYALTDGLGGTPVSAFNFNSVPFSAIDRVDYLKDGASAIYGSDAITGVYNIILKKNFTGTSVDFSLANTFKHDSLFRRESVTTGFAKAGWQITASVNHQVGHSNFIRDFGITTTDYRYLGVKGQAVLTVVNVPSPIQLTAPQALASGMGSAGYYVIPGARPTANPTKASFVYVGPTSNSIPRENAYDFADDVQYKPDSEATSGFLSIDRSLTRHITAFGQLIHSRSKTYYELAPAGYSTTLNGYTLSADNPYNPFGVSLTNSGTGFAYTFSGRGFRPKREAADVMTALATGVRGTLREHWNWQVGFSYARDKTTRGTDLIPVENMLDALGGTTRTTAFNPFGPSDNPNLVPGLYRRILERDNYVDTVSYDFSVSGQPWQIPIRSAGPLGVAAGFEYRENYLRGTPDRGDYVGFATNEHFEGQRDSQAVFVELSLPVQKWLEFQIAGRREEYSDAGHTTKPKYSARLNLPKNRFVNVLVRASYSESFKVPDLGQSYQLQSAATATIVDPLRLQDGVRTVTVIQGGNPDLRPEEGKVQYVGFVLEVPAIKGLSLTADYFDMKIDNVIGRLSIGYLLSPEGLQQFPNAVIRSNAGPPPGPIVQFSGIAENLGFQLFRGWDFGLRYDFRTERFGAFNLRAEATQTNKRGIDSGLGAGFSDQTGYYNAPVWRSNLGAGWAYQALSVAVNADIIGKLHNRSYTAVGWGDNVYTLINPSVTYRGFKKLRVTVGMNNIFNHRPPAVGFSQLGFDERSLTAAGFNGRLYHFRVRKEF